MKTLWSSLLLLFLAGCPAGQGHRGAANERVPEVSKLEAARLSKLAKLELDRGKAQRLAKIAHETRCPCRDMRASLAECAESCAHGPFALRAIGRYVSRELADAQIASLLLERFGPRQREQIDVKNAPCHGSERAPVTLVVFSDFQCPYCALAGRMLGELKKRAGEKLRICFKSFLIHKEAEQAVHAAFAAHEQGKFWPFHDKLFANMRAQSKADLLGYAKELGLDVARLERDMQGAEVMNAVLRDGIAARRLRLRGTPAFFLNGRPFSDPKNLPTFLDWIEEELVLQAQATGQQPGSQPTSQPVSK